jgi:transcriptional regulator with XRE-family HTH domain
MKSLKQEPNDLVFYRRRMGLNQEQVARLLGMHGTAEISRYETGSALPSLPTALRLEIILRVPVAFLFPSMYRKLKSQIRRDEDDLAGRETDLFPEDKTA